MQPLIKPLEFHEALFGLSPMCLSSLQLGFGSVWVRFGSASVLFGFGSVRLRFCSGSLRFGFCSVWIDFGSASFYSVSLQLGFGSVWVRFGSASVLFGSASVRFRICSGSLRFGFCSVWVRFGSASFCSGSLSGSLRLGSVLDFVSGVFGFRAGSMCTASELLSRGPMRRFRRTTGWCKKYLPSHANQFYTGSSPRRCCFSIKCWLISRYGNLRAYNKFVPWCTSVSQFLQRTT